VICAYQAAGTVVAAVDSALAQTLAPHEVIVVDDGSTDGTEQLLEPYSDRIVYVRKANGGGASALNAGLEVVGGDFLAILDADDVYEPERLEALAALGEARPDLDILATDAVIVSGERAIRRYAEGSPFPTTDQRSAILAGCFVAAPAIRVAALHAVGGFDESFPTAYDWDCWLRLVLSGSLAGLVDEPLYVYRYVGGSLSARRVRDLRARVRLLEKAAARDDLSGPERSLLERQLGWRRREALLAEAEEALLAGDRDARARSLAIVHAPGMGLATRLKAAAAVVAPQTAARLLAGRPESRRLARPSGAVDGS
jgi:glycosyltransferase involved in cell wall biosynthesis